MKKVPLVEKDKFLDYCHFSSARANFPTFKKWLIERWHRLKDASNDAQKPDKSLQYWQNDIQIPMHQLLLEDVDSKEETEMTDWTPVRMSADGEGNSYFTYEAPAGNDYGFFEYREGKFQKIKKAVFPGAKRQFIPKQEKGGAKPLGYDKTTKPKTCQHCKRQATLFSLVRHFKPFL